MFDKCCTTCPQASNLRYDANITTEYSAQMVDGNCAEDISPPDGPDDTSRLDHYRLLIVINHIICGFESYLGMFFIVTSTLSIVG